MELQNPESQEDFDLGTDPSKKRRKLTRHLPGLAVFVFALAYFLPQAAFGVGSLFDEGIQVFGAERVLAGDTPYLDFYCIYGPGTFYWLAGLFKVFGVQLIVSRFNDAVICALTGSFIFTICRKSGLANSWSLIPTMLFLAALEGNMLKIVSPALMLLLAAGLRLSADLEQNRRPIATGLLLGLAAVFRHDFGVFGFVASLLVISWPRDDSPEKKEIIRSSVSLVTGFLLVAGTVYGALLFAGFYAVFQNLVIYPSTFIPYRVLPYPIDQVITQSQGLAALLSDKNVFLSCAIAFFSISKLLVFTGPILTVLLLAPIVNRKLRGVLFQNKERQTFFLYLVALVIQFITYVTGRLDFWHLLPMFVLSLPIWIILIHFYISRYRKVASLLRPILFLLMSFMMLNLAGIFFINIVNYQKGSPVKLKRAQGMVVDTGKESAGLFEIIHKLETDKRQTPIYVGAQRHDKVYVNAIMIYFLSGRRNATYYYHLEPGITTTRAVQENIIEDLISNQVDTVVLWDRDFVDEPNRSRESSGVTLLDEFIDREYKRSTKIGVFMLKRK